MNFRGSNKTWSVDVASYPPNAYGLYDMTGNVREWVEDTYEKDFYKRACVRSPWRFESFSKMLKDPLHVYKSDCNLDPINKTPSKYKSNRGGSWDYSEGYPATVSFRFFDELDKGYKDLGFRCAANAKKSSWIGLKYDSLVDDMVGTDDTSQLQDISSKQEKLNGSLMEDNMKEAKKFKKFKTTGSPFE